MTLFLAALHSSYPVPMCLTLLSNPSCCNHTGTHSPSLAPFLLPLLPYIDLASTHVLTLLAPLLLQPYQYPRFKVKKVPRGPSLVPFSLLQGCQRHLPPRRLPDAYRP
jgi:hypothetical protein